ncbi:MAG TPA: hypothetical protein VGA61_06110 [Anaerolineae bacterium]
MAKANRPGGKSARRANGRAATRRGVPAVAWIALGGLILVLAGLLLTRQSLSSTATAPAGHLVAGKPKLAVDRETIDLGRVPLDKPVTATFKLTNLGDQPLKLAEVPAVQVVKGC